MVLMVELGVGGEEHISARGNFLVWEVDLPRACNLGLMREFDVRYAWSRSRR